MEKLTRRRFLGLLAAGPLAASCAGPQAARRVGPGLGLLFARPQLGDEQIIARVAGLRPFRRGGLRLELESIDGFPVIHNYGHGGGGITTAWGCAVEVLRLAHGAGFSPSRLAPSGTAPRVAVIGAGISGLTSACRLREVGFDTRIVYRETTPDTVSDVAGGQWAPSLLAWGSGAAAGPRRERILRDSLQRYRAEVPLDVGVSEVPNFVEAGYGASVAKMAGEFLPAATRWDPLPLQGLLTSGTQVDTLLIEPPRYLRELWHRLRDAGVEEQQAELESTADFAKLGVDFVVNATGLGARELCHDSMLMSIRGQLVHLRAQPLGYLMSHRGGYMFSRGDVLVLGGSVERGVELAETTDATCARILRRHRDFFGA
jgi:glycine/D-amino acid oxidase-like deaminating enzyme